MRSTLKIVNSLAKLTDKRYQIVLEESWQHESPELSLDRIWYEQIPCQGKDCFIGVYSLDPLILQLSTSRARNARTVYAAIKDMPGVRPDFHFDGEAVIYFPIEAVHIVADLAGARKKRRLSPEAKARLIERGKAHRFLSQNTG
ncbi:MAG: hypothetical protein WB948_10825 [Desulfobaccales bacterium]